MMRLVFILVFSAAATGTRFRRRKFLTADLDAPLLRADKSQARLVVTASN
jgi:hypothetical protein